MSEPKVKPSIAARELAEALFPDFTPEIHVGYADIIQSHLADLLEKAKWLIVYAEAADLMSPSFVALKSALAPWKTTI